VPMVQGMRHPASPGRSFVAGGGNTDAAEGATGRVECDDASGAGKDASAAKAEAETWIARRV